MVDVAIKQDVVEIETTKYEFMEEKAFEKLAKKVVEEHKQALEILAK